MKTQEKDKRILGLPRNVAIFYVILVIGSTIVYTLIWKGIPETGGDSEQYIEVAVDLMDSKIDALPFRPLGYPFLLYVTGAVENQGYTLFYLSVILHWASIWLLALVLFNVGIPDTALKIFVVIMSLPLFASHIAVVLTENLTQFLLCAVVFCLYFGLINNRKSLLCVAAATAGLSAFVRPEFQMLIAFIVVSLLLVNFCLRSISSERRRITRNIAILLAVNFTLLGAYFTFNHLKFGYFGITPRLGFNLCSRTVPVLERLPVSYEPIRSILIERRDQHLVKSNSSHSGYSYIWGLPATLQNTTGLSLAQLDRYLTKLNLELIISSPLNYIAEVAHAASRYWLPYVPKRIFFGSSLIRVFWIITHFLVVFCFFAQLTIILGVFAIVLGRTFWRKLEIVIDDTGGKQLSAYVVTSAVVLNSAIASCLVEAGDPRYRTSVDIFIVALTILGFSIVYDRLIKQDLVIK